MGIIPEVKIEEEKDLMYLVIKIDKYPTPISYQGKFYLRSGSNNHEVTGAYTKIGYFKKNDADLIYQDEIHGLLIMQAIKVDETV